MYELIAFFYESWSKVIYRPKFLCLKEKLNFFLFFIFLFLFELREKLSDIQEKYNKICYKKWIIIYWYSMIT